MVDNQIYGYVWASAKEQNEDKQLIAMRDFGIFEKNIFIEKQSVKDFSRPAYKRLIKKIKPGDTLVIKSIDRLGWNYAEIIEQWQIITKEIQAAIVVIDIPLLDTRKKDLDLSGTFIADLVLQILSCVTQAERMYNHQRQAEGIAAAKMRGVKFGRPAMARSSSFEAVCEMWKNKQISARAAAKQLGVTHRTFLKWARGK